MTNALSLYLLAIGAGAAFGALYLTLLWYGVHLLAGRSLLFLFILMGLLRVCLLVMALIGGLALGATAGHIAAGLLGFIMVRIAATRTVKTARNGAMEWK